ncbi:hypothetical protein MNB_SV-4-334 [hydrothermal vent metagenome]|uniref:YtkA-like domain-containing protein n=1 Tax=hydrothermal vent metagenome TaxID=652676 RepID=A0A1W1E9X4_9ZZZZ
MAKGTKEKSYWPHMIMGFLLIGMTLGYWTVKSASSAPVQETNDYMMKYQQADIHINEILAKKQKFDSSYAIVLDGAKKAKLELENVKRTKDEEVVLLHPGANTFTYRVIDKNNQPVNGIKVDFLLTRPHTDKDNVLLESIPSKDGEYVAKVNVIKPGRYILRLKATVDKNTIGYLDTPAYLNP